MTSTMYVDLTDWSALKKENSERRRQTGTVQVLLTEITYLRYQNREGKFIETPLSPPKFSCFDFEVRLFCMSSSPHLRNLYISSLISRSTSSSILDCTVLRYDLANKIANFGVGLINCTAEEDSNVGFLVVADVDVVREELVDVDDEEEEEEEEEVDGGGSDDDSELDICVICMEDLCDMERLGAILPCSHRFHRVCICRWVMQKWCCPSCRGEFTVALDDDDYDDSDVVDDDNVV